MNHIVRCEFHSNCLVLISTELPYLKRHYDVDNIDKICLYCGSLKEDKEESDGSRNGINNPVQMMLQFFSFTF